MDLVHFVFFHIFWFDCTGLLHILFTFCRVCTSTRTLLSFFKVIVVLHTHTHKNKCLNFYLFDFSNIYGPLRSTWLILCVYNRLFLSLTGYTATPTNDYNNIQITEMSIVCAVCRASSEIIGISFSLSVCLFVCLFVVGMVSTLKLTTGSESYFNDLHRYTTEQHTKSFDSSI